jgi:hypothetical protein
LAFAPPTPLAQSMTIGTGAAGALPSSRTIPLRSCSRVAWHRVQGAGGHASGQICCRRHCHAAAPYRPAGLAGAER